MDKILGIFSNTKDGAYAVDGNQRIIFWNQAAEEMFGYTADEAVGHVCWQLLHGHSADGKQVCQNQCGILQHIKKGAPGDYFDLLVKHRNGHNVLVNVSTLPLLTENNSVEQPHLMHLARFQAKQPLQPNRLRIHLLGPMLVWRPDGSLVEGPLWQRVKVRALLVYLALKRGPVSREVLVDILWPDLNYTAALRNLNTTVYNLRRSLEPGLSKGSDSQFISYKSGYYLLDGHSEHWLDVDAFEKGIHRARIEREPHKSIDIYKDALALYRGEYLFDLGNTQISSTGEQHRFYERNLSGLEELAMLYEQTYQDDAAKDIYLKIMAIDPCRESACQKLMRLLLRYDNMAEAASHCSRLNKALRLELDMVPSPETRRLCKLAKCEL